jgi:transaldolase/glucose-6-phosphate isomerase
VFLEVTHDPQDDVPVEGKPYTFGVVEAAQARGDFEVLGQRHRRAMRVHVTGDLDVGLQALALTMAEVLA